MRQLLLACAGWLLFMTACAPSGGDTPPDEGDADAAGEGGAEAEAGCFSGSWSVEEELESGPPPLAGRREIDLAFNNTPVAVRVGGTLHVVWTAGGSPRWGHRAEADDAWWIVDLDRWRGGRASKATIAAPDDSTLLAAWSEDGRAVASRSVGGGPWEPIPVMSPEGVRAEGLSLAAVPGPAGGPRAVLAWKTGADVAAAAWVGAGWTTDAWEASALPLPARPDPAGEFGDIAVAAGPGGSVVATWDYDADPDAPGPTWIYLAVSTDGGRSFGDARRLPVTQAGQEESRGNDAAVCIDGAGRTYVTYQDAGRIWAAVSTDGGATFAPAGGLGDDYVGLFAHAACRRDGDIALAWELFTGDSHDDARKTVGLGLSCDALETVTGPHAMPGSEDMTGRIQGAVVLDDRFLDVLWIAVDSTAVWLQHRKIDLR